LVPIIYAENNGTIPVLRRGCSLPVSDDQVVAEISDLGMELYVNRRKVDMLQDPSTYLLQRNKELLKAASGTSNICNELMVEVVKGVVGTISPY